MKISQVYPRQNINPIPHGMPDTLKRQIYKLTSRFMYGFFRRLWGLTKRIERASAPQFPLRLNPSRGCSGTELTTEALISIKGNFGCQIFPELVKSDATGKNPVLSGKKGNEEELIFQFTIMILLVWRKL